MSSHDIAIIGMAGRFPAANSIEEFWTNICGGKDCIAAFSEKELREEGIPSDQLAHPQYVRRKGYLAGWDCFDSDFFDYSATEARIMDPQIRLMHECAWLALEDAGYASVMPLNPVGLFVGGSSNPEWFCAAQREQQTPADKYLGIALNDHHALSTRISYRLNLTGPSLTLQTACSSSLVAVHYACQAILSGECRAAIAGGVSLTFPPKGGYLHEPGMVTSPDGFCRSFDAAGKGTLAGDGCALVVLKSRAEAIAKGDYIYAVIKATAVNNDGRNKIGYSAPGIAGQVEVIRATQRAAGVAPETIGLMEAHGTATPLGDPVEIAALMQAFNTSRRQYCAIGSVKSNIGHLNHAAGVAGLIKTALALNRRILPRTLHFEKPNPEIDFESSPFYVQTETRPWISDGSRRRAAVSSFGIGGTNAHAVLEEEAEVARREDDEVQTVVLSAKTPDALDRARRELADFLEGKTFPLRDIAYTLQNGRASFRHRAALVGSDVSAVSADLRAGSGRNYLSGSALERPLRVALMLPGQGSQYAGMGAGLCSRFHIYRETVEECLASLQPELRGELRPILTSTAAGADVHQTRLAQPALFICEYACFRLLSSLGIEPVALLGHSLGELVAACIAGVFEIEDGLRLAAIRGELMQSAPAGRMLSVAAPAEEMPIAPPPNVVIAAINGPRRFVVAGPVEDIARFARELAARQIDAREMMTSHAFHSPSMEPVLERFESAVASVRRRKPSIPFLSNVTGSWIRPEDAMDPSYWARQLRQPVQFSAALSTLFKVPQIAFLEAGPGVSLSALARTHDQCAPDAVLANAFRRATETENEVAVFKRGLATLWCHGVEVDWARMDERDARRVPLPGYSFERRKFPSVLRSAPKTGRETFADQAGIYQPVWRRAHHSATAGPVEVILFAPASWAFEAAEFLRRDGHTITTIVPGERFERLGDRAYALAPSSREQYRQLISELTRRAALSRFVMHAWPLGSGAGFDEIQEAGFYSLLYLAQALSEAGATGIDISAITLDALAAPNSAKISPAQATVYGLCPAINQECPGMRCRGVDISSGDLVARGPQAIARQILQAQIAGALEHGTALRNGEFWRAETIRISLPKAAEPIRPAAAVAIIGGFGNLGMALAEYLISRVGANIALIGRHPHPNSSEFVKQIVHRGARICTAIADCTQPAELRNALSYAEREIGPLHGVIHAAAATRTDSISTPIVNLRREHCEEQFGAKVRGVLALNDALEGRRPDFVVLMSSLASELGGIGLGAYAAANRFMDAFAESRGHGSTPWIAINWDGWHVPGQQTSERWKGRSRLLEVEEGLDIFGSILACPANRRLLVSTSDLETRRGEWLAPAASEAGRTIKSRPDGPQARLIAIWEQFFGRTGFTADHRFYEVGGDSLMAISLVSRINAAFSAHLQVGEFLRAESIGNVYSLLEAGAGSAKTGPAVVRSEARDRYPTSFEQQSMLSDRNSVYPTRFNCSLAFEMKEAVDPDRLESAFRKLIAGEEILRTYFDRDSRWQRVAAAVPFHLRHISDDARDAMLRFVEPFDPAEPPLVRAAIVDAPSHPRTLLIDIHHALTDAVSLNRVMAELWTLYEGRECFAPGVHYRDYAIWQRAQAMRGAGERDRAFWMSKLDGFIWTQLPSRCSAGKPEFAQTSVSIAPRERTILARFCERTGLTSMAVLLAALASSISRITAQDDIAIGLRVSRRNRTELERMLGPFVEDTALRLRIQDEQDLPRRAFEETAMILDHAFYPYDQLNDEIQSRRPTPNSELFSIMVNYVPAIRNSGAAQYRMLPRAPHSKYDLNLRFRDGESLVMDAKYRADKYSLAFVQDFLASIADYASETCAGRKHATPAAV